MQLTAAPAGSAAHGATPAPASASSSGNGDGDGDGGGSDTLAIIALVVGAAGLALGAVALATGRRGGSRHRVHPGA